MKPTNSPLLQSSRLLAVASLSLGLAVGVRAADTPAPATTPPATAPAAGTKALTFTADVQPLLTKYCYVCHGGPLTPAPASPATKSALSLDTLDNATKGGRSKKAGIVPGKAADSEIIRRISLDAADKQIMPPKGKPAPTAAEIKLITDWVNAGAAK